MPLPENSLIILDVGHGNSAVITAPKGTIVIDAGPQNGLLEFLTEQNIRRINSVLISHADQDHISGLVQLLSERDIQIDSVYLNTDSLQGSAIWDDLVFTLDQEHLAGRIKFNTSLTSNDNGKFNQDAICIEILGPRPGLTAKGPGGTDEYGRKIKTNSISAVVRVMVNNIPIALLTGDIDHIGLDSLIAGKININAAILIFPHHGGLPRDQDVVEFTTQLYDMVSPDTIIFSIGREKHKNPNQDIVRILHERAPDSRIICTQLSKHCSRSLPEESPEHLTAVFSKGRDQQRCCCGSIVVDLSNPEDILPTVEEHRDFIDTFVQDAICIQ